MELIMIVCSATLSDDIEDLFIRNNIQNYTLMPEVYGSGQGGSKRLNTEVWPGINLMYLVSTTPENSKAIKEWAKEYRKQETREGLKIFALALNEVI